jgi:hypothetical protein
MTKAELIRVYQRNLQALGTHAIAVSMDDREHILAVRVLIRTAEELLKETGETNDAIEEAAWALTDYARTLYVDSCLKSHPEISNKAEYAEESGELFDYVFHQGSYPDE